MIKGVICIKIGIKDYGYFLFMVKRCSMSDRTKGSLVWASNTHAAFYDITT